MITFAKHAGMDGGSLVAQVGELSLSTPGGLAQRPLWPEASLPPVAVWCGHSHLCQLLSCGFVEMPQGSDVHSHLHNFSQSSLEFTNMFHLCCCLLLRVLLLCILSFTAHLVLPLLATPFDLASLDGVKGRCRSIRYKIQKWGRKLPAFLLYSRVREYRNIFFLKKR